MKVIKDFFFLKGVENLRKEKKIKIAMCNEIYIHM
jgi:hypothetical protein